MEVEDVFIREVDVDVVDLDVDWVAEVGGPDGVHDEDGPPESFPLFELYRMQEGEFPVESLDEGGAHCQTVEGEGCVGAVEALEVEGDEDEGLDKLEGGFLVGGLVEAHRGHVEGHAGDVARGRVVHVLFADGEGDKEVADPKRLFISELFVGLVDLGVKLSCVEEVVFVAEEGDDRGNKPERICLVWEHDDARERRVQRGVLEEVASLRECPVLAPPVRVCPAPPVRFGLPRDGKEVGLQLRVEHLARGDAKVRIAQGSAGLGRVEQNAPAVLPLLRLPLVSLVHLVLHAGLGLSLSQTGLQEADSRLEPVQLRLQKRHLFLPLRVLARLVGGDAAGARRHASGTPRLLCPAPQTRQMRPSDGPHGQRLHVHILLLLLLLLELCCQRHRAALLCPAAAAGPVAPSCHGPSRYAGLPPTSTSSSSSSATAAISSEPPCATLPCVDRPLFFV